VIQPLKAHGLTIGTCGFSIQQLYMLITLHLYILYGTGGEVKGKLANAVGSQYSSHYLGTRCIQHYYR